MDDLFDVDKIHRATLNAGKAGDLKVMLRLAGHLYRLVQAGYDAPDGLLWLWDPEPTYESGGPPVQMPPLAIAGPTLVALHRDRSEEVEAWLARCIARAYAGDWGELCREDKAANKTSLKEGSRMLCIYPWFDSSEPALWIWLEAGHTKAPRVRRLTALHRQDY